MKRSSLAAVALLAAILWGSPLEASLQAGNWIRFGNGPGDYGGIFHIDNLTNGDQFDTFCVELEEHIRFGATYAVEAIALKTNRTGRQLTDYTAWLYTQYLDGTLADFSVDTANANTLQLGIWLGMGYTQADIDSLLGSSFYTDHIGLLNGKSWVSDFNYDKGQGAWSGTGDIYVMNLRKVNRQGDYTSYAQDQLVRIPQMPEPSTLVVWSLLGLAAVVVTRRTRVERSGR